MVEVEKLNQNHDRNSEFKEYSNDFYKNPLTAK